MCNGAAMAAIESGQGSLAHQALIRSPLALEQPGVACEGRWVKKIGGSECLQSKHSQGGVRYDLTFLQREGK